ncbi:uncharacterized protein LOC142634786 [Castanea sativa]|uniref:uncharacterized protein LOC142634786 n=1 Tax=Castanea sativa TaxID=21020 RepID=UPI003F649D69
MAMTEPCWMDPIIDFLAEDRVPANAKEADKWGLDIIGPFPRATGNCKFVLVAMDYFTKWAEFDSKAFRKFCSDLGVKNRYSTSAYPQSNGQVEAVNKAIVTGLKKRLEGTKGMWVDELPNILWAYKTTPRRFIGETHFSLTCGGEAVIPAKISLCSARISRFVPPENEELIMKQLDSLEECRESMTIRLVEYQQKLARRYNQNIRSRSSGLEIWYCEKQ